MKRRIHLGFLWHMHQPYYRDPVEDIYILPWVRLHAVNAYYTMPVYASRFENLRMTFNLVPSLLEQLEDYIEQKANDLYENFSRKPADELEPGDRTFILRNFYMANWETMIRPNARYNDLLLKRGYTVHEQQLDDVARAFSTQDFIDLQTWFNLAWLGPAARDEDPEIGRLLKKGRFFTEEEKNYIIDYHYEIIRKVIPAYRSLLEDGLAELTFSPFYHPILPLLCDSDVAADAHPGVKLPVRYVQPGDAGQQIKLGMDKFERHFGSKPSGMWPSEGSVSPAAVSAAREAGLKWLATDEEILLKSLADRQPREKAIYKPYSFNTGAGEIAVFFRDKYLSDLIGFTYAHNTPEAAVADFLSNLTRIADAVPKEQDQVFVSVILDGENPWEYFQGCGRYFLLKFFKALQDEERIVTSTFSGFLERHPPKDSMEKLAPGSWISGNFDIWIGKEEANLAWDSLSRARTLLMRSISDADGADPAVSEMVLRSIYRAEGSDWFWWFDDDFTSETEMEFDFLFRKHLAWAFQYLGQQVPDFLKEPIKKSPGVILLREPTDFIKPAIDGEITHFYEWANAGVYDIGDTGGAMYDSANQVLKEIFFGFDLENLYFRLDPLPAPKDADRAKEQLTIQILFLEIDKLIAFNWSPGGPGPDTFVLYELPTEGEHKPIKPFDTVSASRIIELAVPFAELGLAPGDNAKMITSIYRKGLEIRRHPAQGFISFKVPDESYHLRVWSV